MNIPQRSIVLIARSGDVRLFRVREGSRTSWLVISPDGEESFDLGYAARCKFDRIVGEEGKKK